MDALQNKKRKMQEDISSLGVQIRRAKARARAAAGAAARLGAERNSQELRARNAFYGARRR